MSVINTNYLALVSQNNLTKSQNSLGTAIERLSSGLRINSAKDDAAGQAIANRFTANINGLTQAARNANDGISIAQTTEGSLNEINENLQRIRTLTVQASTGSNSDSDLQSIQNEINERMDEINRISKETQFNGVKVLGDDAAALTVQVGAHDNQTITINLSKIDSKTLNLDGFSVSKSIDTANYTSAGGKVAGPGVAIDTAAVDVTALTEGTVATDKLFTDGEKFYVKVSGETTEAGANGFHEVTVDEDGAITGTVGTTAATVDSSKIKELKLAPNEIDASGADAANLQARKAGVEGTTGPEYVIQDGDKYFAAKVSDTGEVTRGAELKVGKEGTADPLKALDSALQQVDDLRSHLGAIQNRFQSTIANLNNTVNNLSAARSRIEDADYAVEVSNMTRSQILQQAGTSVLAQANQVPQTVLSLLR
ncbi:FliC/FljB family flagellin [Alcaligenes nematophilus]